MSHPLVSVIIPTYNSEKYIRRCLESIVDQSWNTIEIIIIDNGSNDSTVTIINDYINNYENIIYLKEARRGPSFARNFGIENATGEYIVFIDSDDYIDKKYIENLVLGMKNNNIDLVTCGYYDISKYGVYALNDFYEVTDREKLISSIFKGVGGVLWGKMFKVDIIKRHNIKMDESIFMCEDLLFVLKYCLECKKTININKPLYFYNRLNEFSISSNINLSYFDNLEKVNNLIREILNITDSNSKGLEELINKREFELNLLKLKFIVLSAKNRKTRYEKIAFILQNQDFNQYLEVHKQSINIILFYILKYKKYILIDAYLNGERYIQQLKDFVRFKLLNK